MGVTDQQPYDYRNCQSLFGYAAAVHSRSGGICQLCCCGSDRLDFDLWRQLTVEHLIGETQGGYRRQIRTALVDKFPQQPAPVLDDLEVRIDEANTVTACSFCNATTSRNKAPSTMTELIRRAPDDPESVLAAVANELHSLLERKRGEVEWKLRAVRTAFDEQAAPSLRARRATT
jgi:hypothetical protein